MDYFLGVEEYPPTIIEVKKAVDSLRSGKAAGEDGLPPEVWKALEVPQLQILVMLIRLIWTSCANPEDWLLALVLPLYKKGDASNCGNYRGISLLDIAYKVLETIIACRVRQAVDESLRENQGGFRKHRGCVDQIFCLRQILEQRHEFRRATYMAFVDFAAAFDSVDRSGLWEVLASYGVPPHIIRLIKSLYRRTTCKIKVYNQLSDAFEVVTGVRQGAVLSPLLFNIAIDWVLKMALDQFDWGVVVSRGGLKVTDLDFADDVGLLSGTSVFLQTMLDNVVEYGSRVGLKINAAKTKVMCCGAPPVVCFVEGQALEVVNEFTYLGSSISSDGDASSDIQQRIQKAQGAFSMLGKLWKNRRVALATKRRVYLASVRPVLMYGCETWPIKASHIQKMEVFERRCWRRILRVRMWDHVTNDQLAQRIGIDVTVGKLIKIRRLKWFGHVSRMDNCRLPKILLFATQPPTWKRPFCGPKKTWKRQLFADFNIPMVANNFRGNFAAWKKQWLPHCANLAQDRVAFNQLVDRIAG